MLRLPQNPEEICLLLSANTQYVLAFAEHREAFEAAASGESHVYAGCPICMLAVKSSCTLLLQATKLCFPQFLAAETVQQDMHILMISSKQCLAAGAGAPARFYCPMSHRILQDPVMLYTGQS